MYQIGERERSKMRQELKDLSKEIETMQVYDNTTESNLFKIIGIFKYIKICEFE